MRPSGWRKRRPRRAATTAYASVPVLVIAGLAARCGTILAEPARICDRRSARAAGLPLAMPSVGARGSSDRSMRGELVFVRVVRFTDVTAERVESLLARIDESGPPPGVPIKKLQVVFDQAQGTAVVLQYFDSEADLRTGTETFAAMDPSETPGRRVSVDTGELKVERGGPEAIVACRQAPRSRASSGRHCSTRKAWRDDASAEVSRATSSPVTAWSERDLSL